MLNRLAKFQQLFSGKKLDWIDWNSQ